MEKYYKQDLSQYKRSVKNQNLYKEVYGKYDDLENLPIPDNTNEIDIDKLKEILEERDTPSDGVSQSIRPQSTYQKMMTNRDLVEQEQKIHDINELLAKAKNDNQRLKESNKKLIDTNYNILETLEENRLTINDIQKASAELADVTMNDNASPTKRLEDNLKNTKTLGDTLPLDLLSDLKPTSEDTIITKPIKAEEIKPNTSSDIPIVSIKGVSKEEPSKEEKEDDSQIKENKEIEDTSFYSGSFKFSKKDFDNPSDNDFFDDVKPKNHYFLKILFLIIGLSICGTIIYFFIKYYGINT